MKRKILEIKLRSIVIKIKSRDYTSLDGIALREKFYIEKARYLKDENIQNCLVNIFAVILEVFKRVLKIIPYDEQLMCALAMHKGYITEMKTGEGKTISAVFTAIMNSFKDQVHIVTVNDYLAKRDYKNMEPIYEFLKVSCMANSDDLSKKKEIYQSDVIYTSSSELIFDFLKNEIDRKYPFGKLDTAILDEIDFILLDNANSSFSVSASNNRRFKNIGIYKAVKSIYDSFKGGEISNKITGVLDETYIKEYELDYIYDKYKKTLHITEQGFKKIEKIFGLNSIVESKGLYRALLLTIEAQVFLKNGSDYIVRDGKINLINRANGRIMRNSTKEFGLQQALEIKEGLKVSGANNFQNRMSYQVFFSKYKNLTGMSGTAVDAQDEFTELFGSPIYVVPYHKKHQRIDYEDRIFKTKIEKIKDLLERVKSLNKKGQPILIITENEKESLEVFQLIEIEGLSANILSSDSMKDEEKIVNYCGEYGAITISTNMAGRGTDVKLKDRAREAGGLFVIALNKFESIRIDNQVRGRSGRQGERGNSIFLVYLEDTIFESLEAAILNRFKSLNDEEFYSEKSQKKLRKILNKLQKKSDSRAFSFRKYNFYLDIIVDNYKKYLLSYSKNKSIKEIFRQVIEKEEPCLRSKEKVIFLGERITKGLDFKDTIISKKNEMDKKIESFKKNIAKELTEAIINKTFRETWRDLYIELDNLKHDVMMRSGALDKIVQEYIKESEKIVKRYLRFLNLRTIELFLRAEIKEKNDIDIGSVN